MSSIESILFVAAILLLFSVIASKASGKLGVPALVIFLVVGMLAGSDGPGGIYFDNASLAQSLGVVALIFILFSGGLATDFKRIRPVLWKGLSLSTLGVLFTAILVGIFSTAVLGFSILEGLLLGAIVSSTDAAAVFAVLRSRNVSIKARLKYLLELESGSNDPMSVFLTTALIQLMTQPGAHFATFIPTFFQQMVLGMALGYLMGRGSVIIINRMKLEYEGLYPVLILALIALTYSLTTSLNGNGFLAVYVAGVTMGRLSFAFKKSIMRFQDGLAWLMQIAMFLVLGLLVFPSRLGEVGAAGSLIALFLILIARPIAVNLSLLFSKLNWRERLLLSWVGLRGAVPIIMATFPLLAHIEKAEIIFHLVFFIVIASVLLQGTTIPFFAKLLKLDAPLEKDPMARLEFDRPEGADVDLVELIVPYESKVSGKSIIGLNLPDECLITLICRGEKYIVPRGTTTLEGGDVIIGLVNNENLSFLQGLLNTPMEGPSNEEG